jgi:hypothetical protein
LRRFDDAKWRAIGEEITQLLAAGFIKEVFHPKWIANPILVWKKNGMWRMCVDYTSLNKACPKVPYPLLLMDQVVDSTIGCKTLCFLDAYSGYHQIGTNESDQLATSFITPFGTYCYVMMPFDLKNAGATYQHCMQRCLDSFIGEVVEVYIDDIMVKSRKVDHQVEKLEQTFSHLWSYWINLNPEKCVFEMPKGKLLSFIISEHGIEANPKKIAAIQNLGPITNLKGAQKLMGCLAYLSQFISWLEERGMPLYKLLWKFD